MTCAVFGISVTSGDEPPWPLMPEGRVRFRAWEERSRGYFELIGEEFNRFARRDSDHDIFSLHVIFSLRGDDLAAALEICSDLELEIKAYPQFWRVFLGTRKRPGHPEERLEPQLNRRRALGLVALIRALILRAQELDGTCWFGTAAAARAMCASPTAKQDAEKAMSFEVLESKVSNLPGKVACIEALWDGDTEGWFIRLSAITLEGPQYKEHFLVCITKGNDARLFNGQVPPWPESVHAMDVGQRLAASVGAEFYFPGLDAPDDGHPSWLDQMKSRRPRQVVEAAQPQQAPRALESRKPWWKFWHR